MSPLRWLLIAAVFVGGIALVQVANLALQGWLQYPDSVYILLSLLGGVPVGKLTAQVWHALDD